MIKFFAKRRHRKGFTLTELIVATAIVGILMACVVAFAGPIRRTISGTTARSDATTINKIIGDYVERRLAYANHVEVFVAMPYVPGSGTEYTKLKNAYTFLTTQEAQAGQTNTGRIMIFHYDNSGSADSHTYKLYDIPVSDLTSVPVDFSQLCKKGGSLYKDSYKVFTDEFYGGYQYFFTMDDFTVRRNDNPINRKVYLNFRIDSYDCKGAVQDSAGNTLSFSATDIHDYHKYVEQMYENPGSASLPTNPMEKFSTEKTGTENISFSVQNINNDSSITLVQGKEVGTSTCDYAEDIIIFYNVRTYDIANDTI